MAKQENMVQRVVFTVNNYTEADFDIVKNHAEFCKFIVCGREVGDSGTPHLQGFMNLKARTRFNNLKCWLPSAHFEKAKGTDQQNLDYCTKQDKNAFISGEPQGRGKRNDLKAATKAVLEGKSTAEVALTDPTIFVKYSRGLQTLAEALRKPRNRDDPPTVLWFWGKAGVGKTRFAYDNFDAEQIYMKDSTRWWDGYMQQQCILIDDFDGEWPFRDFIKLLDRYQYRAQIKGGYVQINSPFIIITCEFAPERFWEGNTLAQVRRRISMVVNIKADGEYVPT